MEDQRLSPTNHGKEARGYIIFGIIFFGSIIIGRLYIDKYIGRDGYQYTTGKVFDYCRPNGKGYGYTMQYSARGNVFVTGCVTFEDKADEKASYLIAYARADSTHGYVLEYMFKSDSIKPPPNGWREFPTELVVAIPE